MLFKLAHKLNWNFFLSFSSYFGLDFYVRYYLQHCFTRRPAGSTVSEDVGNEPRAVATLALAARRSNPIELDLIHNWNLRPNKLRRMDANSMQMKDKGGVNPGKHDTSFRSTALTL
jgi:hypothetical protein